MDYVQLRNALETLGISLKDARPLAFLNGFAGLKS